MDKTIWKWMMAGTTSIMLLGFVLAIWAFNRENALALYSGLVMIAAVCVSWWFWVMFIIRSMIAQTERTTKNLFEVKESIVEVRGLVKDYAETANSGNRQRRKPARPKLVSISSE